MSDDAETGLKYDDEKLDYSTISSSALAWLAAALTYGKAKYSRDNYLLIEDFNNRYYAALMRHLEAWRAGESDDPESGLHHLSGVMFAAMALCAKNAPSDLAEIGRRTTAAIARWRATQTAAQPSSRGRGAAPAKKPKAKQMTRQHLCDDYPVNPFHTDGRISAEEHAATKVCACDRCKQKNAVPFSTCKAHVATVSGHHFRMYGTQPKWVSR